MKTLNPCPKPLIQAVRPDMAWPHLSLPPYVTAFCFPPSSAPLPLQHPGPLYPRPVLFPFLSVFMLLSTPGPGSLPQPPVTIFHKYNYMLSNTIFRVYHLSVGIPLTLPISMLSGTVYRWFFFFFNSKSILSQDFGMKLVNALLLTSQKGKSQRQPLFLYT